MRVCILGNKSDDSQMHLLSWLFEKNDVEEIRFIKNENQFMELAKREPPEVAFIMLSNAHPQGLSTLEKLQKRIENMEIILISDVEAYALEAYKVGASGYLVVPLERKKFESCFSKLINYKGEIKT